MHLIAFQLPPCVVPNLGFALDSLVYWTQYCFFRHRHHHLKNCHRRSAAFPILSIMCNSGLIPLILRVPCLLSRFITSFSYLRLLDLGSLFQVVHVPSPQFLTMHKTLYQRNYWKEYRSARHFHSSAISNFLWCRAIQSSSSSCFCCLRLP